MNRDVYFLGAVQNLLYSSSSSSDFLLTCRYRGHIHNSGPPSRQLACCTHGRSHTRSPGVSIMRVDSRELPLSAIPLCQLLPGHYYLNLVPYALILNPSFTQWNAICRVSLLFAFGSKTSNFGFSGFLAVF